MISKVKLKLSGERKVFMHESIGQTIRRLRKEQDYTQTELAELLNISAQAVSRWENGSSMPDISQIVPLASIFGVSTDLLLGRAGISDEEAVKKILQDVEEARTEPMTKESMVRCYTLLQEGLKSYPNHPWLLINCLEYGYCLATPDDPDDPDNAVYYDKEIASSVYGECIRLASLIISYSQNVTDVLRAHMILALLHSVYGNGEEARRHADQFPWRSDMTNHAVYAYIFQNEKDHVNENLEWQCDFMYHLESILDTMTMLGSSYKELKRFDEAIAVLETALQMIVLIAGNTEILPALHYRNNGDDIYVLLAETALEKGNTEAAFEYLKTLVEYDTKMRPHFRNGMKPDTPLLRDLPSHYFRRYYPSMLDNAKRLQEKLSRSSFDPIRNDPGFQALWERSGQLFDKSEISDL